VAPDDYPALALSVAGSHDLPTLRGWWEASDIDLKERLGLYPAAGEVARQHALRARDHAALLAAFRKAGVLHADADPDADADTGDDADAGVDVETLVRAAHEFLARSRSMLAMAQIDDITDESEPVNVPATSEEHPNWRRRLSVDLEALAEHSRLDQVCRSFSAARGSRRRTKRDIA
jgi:4-alpha-glucanotransferase